MMVKQVQTCIGLVNTNAVLNSEIATYFRPTKEKQTKADVW